MFNVCMKMEVPCGWEVTWFVCVRMGLQKYSLSCNKFFIINSQLIFYVCVYICIYINQYVLWWCIWCDDVCCIMYSTCSHGCVLLITLTFDTVLQYRCLHRLIIATIIGLIPNVLLCAYSVSLCMPRPLSGRPALGSCLQSPHSSRHIMSLDNASLLATHSLPLYAFDYLVLHFLYCKFWSTNHTWPHESTSFVVFHCPV